MVLLNACTTSQDQFKKLIVQDGLEVKGLLAQQRPLKTQARTEIVKVE